MSQRVTWTTLETHFMLTIMKERNILSLLDAKRYRNTNIYNIVEEELKKRGFLKTAVQIRTKWKQLKLNYYKAKRSNQKSGQGRLDTEFWNELDELLGHRPAVNIEGGVDSSDRYYIEFDDSMSFPNSELDSSTLIGADSPQSPNPCIPEQLDEDCSLNCSQNPVGKRPNDKENSEPIAGPSGIQKPVKKGKKGSYKEALTSFTKEWKVAVEEATKSLVDKQAEMLKKEFEEQRQWEQTVLREDREANERMLNNIISGFFASMRGQTMSCSFPNPYANPFFNAPLNLDSQTHQKKHNEPDNNDK